MTHSLLIHIVTHDNISDTLHINADEFHHLTGEIPLIGKEFYEILPKTLDKHGRNELKSLKLVNFAVAAEKTTDHRHNETKHATNNPKRKRKAFRNQHVNNLRKAMPALPRRHPVRNQARGTDTQVYAVYETHRSQSGTRATHSNGATSRLTTGVIESRVIYETHSQLKPRSRIGAF